jgi:hypothetical protein
MNAPLRTNLSQEIAIAHRVADALVAAGVTPEDPDYAELMASETDVQKHLARLLRVARREEAESKALDQLQNDMRARQDRKDKRAQDLRAIVKQAMLDLGLKRLPAPDMTVTISAGRQKVVITEEAALPDRFFVTSRSVDKKAVAAALDEGPVPGASLSNGEPSLTIRSR